MVSSKGTLTTQWSEVSIGQATMGFCHNAGEEQRKRAEDTEWTLEKGAAAIAKGEDKEHCGEAPSGLCSSAFTGFSCLSCFYHYTGAPQCPFFHLAPKSVAQCCGQRGNTEKGLDTSSALVNALFYFSWHYVWICIWIRLCVSCQSFRPPGSHGLDQPVQGGAALWAGFMPGSLWFSLSHLHLGLDSWV